MQLPSAPGSPISSVTQMAPSYESFLQARLLLHELYKRRSYSDSEIKQEFDSSSATPEKRARLSSKSPTSDNEHLQLTVNLLDKERTNFASSLLSTVTRTTAAAAMAAAAAATHSLAKFNSQEMFLPVFTKPDSPVNLAQSQHHHPQPRPTPQTADTIVKRGRLIPKPLRIPIAHTHSGSLESDISTPQDSPLDLSVKNSISPKTITDRFVSIITESLSSTSSSPSSVTSSLTLNTIPLSPINLSNNSNAVEVKSECSSPRTPLLQQQHHQQHQHIHFSNSQLHPLIFDIPFATSTISSTALAPAITTTTNTTTITKAENASSTNCSKSELTGRIKLTAQQNLTTKYSPNMKEIHLHHHHHHHQINRIHAEPMETIKVPFAAAAQRSNLQVQTNNNNSSSSSNANNNNGGSNNVAKSEYVCPICSQVFSLHDRLAKHIASRHRNRPTESTGKSYVCDVCKRSFARSDMLTRHMRLHTGIKPYTCRICGQVFSRSDHLSTHQRTHTGEKPYKCPQCPYAACRRDMITRHMRTHARYEIPDSSSTYKDLSESEKK